MDLTNKQWERLSPLLPKAKPLGRPRRDDREVWGGILWILRTGAPWQDLPDRYPPYQCHRRLQEWTEVEVMPGSLERLARDLHEQGDIDLSERFIDGTFAPAKQAGSTSVRLNEVKAPSLWSSQTALVFRKARDTCAASRHAAGATTPNDVKLVSTLKARFLADLPERPIGDKAYDSDPLDSELSKLGIDMISPHRKHRKKPKTQAGRKLRRYKRRRKLGRFFAHLYNFRRIVGRLRVSR